MSEVRCHPSEAVTVWKYGYRFQPAWIRHTGCNITVSLAPQYKNGVKYYSAGPNALLTLSSLYRQGVGIYGR